MLGSGGTTAKQQAAEFLRVASQFQLGDLATEASHPKTWGLAEWAHKDLSKAVAVLHEVDLDALRKTREYLPGILALHHSIHETLKQGGRIYLCGCGATGRLSLSLEFLWRIHYSHTFPLGAHSEDRVRAFMAGGDTALVHALEGFEDYPDFGKRQLLEMGFQDGDLLISCTEGGETPFVIGATLAAARAKGPSPYFLYCNPDDLLREKVERSRQVLDHSGIKKINLFVGPMALAGSTRMQASTILMMAVGLALFSTDTASIGETLESFILHVEQLPLEKLVPFIEREAGIYQNGEHIVYHAEDYAITVFTDTAERAPTFSLPSFENQNGEVKNHSLSYVAIDSTHSAQDSWQKLLGRGARPLNWGVEFPKSNESYLWGFDFSRHAVDYRTQNIPGTHHHFYVQALDREMEWRLGDREVKFPLFQSTLKKSALVSAEKTGVLLRREELFHHLQLKMLLNIHSTLVMGRMDRYRQNFMTWVRPSNGKLVDRAARYVKWLLQEDGIKDISYEEIVTELFNQYEKLAAQQSVVISTYRALLKNGPRAVE